MALPNVSPGDPHAVAHNTERAAINQLEAKADLPTRPSDRAYFQILKALRAGTARIVAMGDSKTEGTAVSASTDRWLYKLQAHLRDLYSKDDAGYGYMPAKYATFYDFDDRPVITGTTTTPASANGLGTRTLKMELGSTVTFPARTFVSGVPLVVHWTRMPSAGELEVVTGSTVHATINTAGTAGSQRTNVTIPAGSHSVILRPKAGTAAITVEGVFHSTSNSGVKVIDGSISGGTFRRFGDAATSTGHWNVVDGYEPHGIIMAFGANDMSERTPAQLVSDAKNAVTRAVNTAPDCGIVILLGTERTQAAETGTIRTYETALRAEFVNQPNVTVLFESDLWLPKAGTDYTWGGPDGWLADTVHTSAYAHSEIARYLTDHLKPSSGGLTEVSWGDVTGKPTSFSPSGHKESHATGGPDPITPQSIGAHRAVPGDSSAWSQSTGGGSYSGHADDMPIGTYYVSGAKAENGWPAEFASEHSVATVAAHYNYARKIQTIVTLYAARMYVRVMHPTTAEWQTWRRIDSASVTPESIGALPADSPKVRDSGWRVISSWGADGVVTGASLASGWAPRSSQAGGIYVRRIGMDLYARFVNVACTTANVVGPPTYGLGFVFANQATATVPGVISSGAGVTRFHPMGPRGDRRSGASLEVGDFFPDLTVTGLSSTETWPTTLPGTPA